MKIASIVGARPQFVKAAVIHRAIQKVGSIKEVIIHSGQHYDNNLSDIFFKELQIPKPDYNLEVGSGSHGYQTGLMLQRFEDVLIKENPDYCIVYGDTNSTIAAALAAVKLHIPCAHIEAGLRSFNRKMPEEINRIATDHISDLLFAPTPNAVRLLEKEGLQKKTINSGDVMYDSILFYSNLIEDRFDSQYNFDNSYILSTLHRPENTDNEKNLRDIFEAFSQINFDIILPLHPRTKKQINHFDINVPQNVKILKPISYLEMIFLIKNSFKVLTDSGGLQKEAYFLKKPCVTLREQTEWVETLDNNWNFIVGTDVDKIIKCVNSSPTGEYKHHFGDGNAGDFIINTLQNQF